MQAQLDCLLHGICPMPDKKQRKISTPGQVQQQQRIQEHGEIELLSRASVDSQLSSVSGAQSYAVSESGSTTGTTASIHSRQTSVADSGVDADVPRGSGQFISAQNVGQLQDREGQQGARQQTKPSQHPHKRHKKISAAATPEMQAQLDCLMYGICPMPDKKQRKTTMPGPLQQQQSIQDTRELTNELPPSMVTHIQMDSGGDTMNFSNPGNQQQIRPVVDNSLGSTVTHQDQGYRNPGYIFTSQSSLSAYNTNTVPEKLESGHDNHHDDSHQQPEKSTEEEKAEWFKTSMSTQLSMIYAIFLVICGTTFYIGDSFKYSDFILGEIFNIYLMTGSLAFLVYMHYDVRKYLKQVSQTLEEAKAELNGTNTKQVKIPERHYGFTSGRHGGSLYLKIGATCFCFGYLTYIGLTLGKMIMHIGIDDCYSLTHVIGTGIHIVYIFYQLFFLFKYSNLIINRYTAASRFGLMHCIASSICFWIFLIYYEVLHSINTKYANESAAKNSTDNWVVKYGCQPTLNDTSTDDLDEIITNLGPYLYPFGVEFNILIVGLWICIWENLGNIGAHDHMPSVQIVSEDNNKEFTSNLVIQVDCHSSNRGIFIGLLFTIYIIISIIIFFVYTLESDNKGDGYLMGMFIRAVSELMILIALLIATLIAYRSIQNLDIIGHEISSVDDLLLFISIPFIFFFAFINIVAYVDQKTIPTEDYILIIVMLLYIIQPIVQTVFICDGLRRCSNTPELQFRKPGREVVTFLIITNVTMWLLETMQINTYGANEAGYYYFGKTMWKVMSHIAMPLSLFYRFHSSVCIADIWKDAYEQEEHH
ncbi:unnamed protein product [Meganyctiphanes norvegica]|uniref:Proton channel OtopLc n=1 Tax=Meganyctiphanes norvegica TaxID=48144 RepID=A0AAV2QR10_MEGNR